MRNPSGTARQRLTDLRQGRCPRTRGRAGLDPKEGAGAPRGGACRRNSVTGAGISAALAEDRPDALRACKALEPCRRADATARFDAGGDRRHRRHLRPTGRRVVTVDQLRQLLGRLTASYPWITFEAATFDAYVWGLRDLPVDEVEQAMAEAIKSRSEEHTSELQSPDHLVCRLLLEKKKYTYAIAFRSVVGRPGCRGTPKQTGGVGLNRLVSDTLELSY